MTIATVGDGIDANGSGRGGSQRLQLWCRNGRIACGPDDFCHPGFLPASWHLCAGVFVPVLAVRRYSCTSCDARLHVDRRMHEQTSLQYQILFPCTAMWQRSVCTSDLA